MDDKAVRYLEGLTACGWTAGLPRSASEALERGIERAIADGEEPWEGIPSVTPDEELYPDTSRGDYGRLLEEFAELTHGLVVVEAIREERDSETLHVDFTEDGEPRRITLTQDDHPFYDALDGFFERKKSPLRFLSIAAEGAGFVLTTEAAFECAMERGLIPDGSDW